MWNMISADKIKKLTTQRLLAYYKKYRKKRHYGTCECCGEILTKSAAEKNALFNDHLDQVKAELDSREHVGAT